MGEHGRPDGRISACRSKRMSKVVSMVRQSCQGDCTTQRGECKQLVQEVSHGLSNVVLVAVDMHAGAPVQLDRAGARLGVDAQADPAQPSGVHLPEGGEQQRERDPAPAVGAGHDQDVDPGETRVSPVVRPGTGRRRRSSRRRRPGTRARGSRRGGAGSPRGARGGGPRCPRTPPRRPRARRRPPRRPRGGSRCRRAGRVRSAARRRARSASRTSAGPRGSRAPRAWPRHGGSFPRS